MKCWSLATYGDGLETRVEDTTVEEGCTGVAEEDGLSDEDEDGFGVEDEDGFGVEDDEGGGGGDEDVGFDVGVGVG
jgi:hypothetical protein